MAKIDFSDYTRLRDIVVKRNKRAVSAGLAPAVHFPTVKEIKSGLVSYKEAMEAVSGYYSGGSQLKTIRETGLVPPVKEFPILPPSKTSEQAKREKRREQQRAYRQRKRIRETALTPEKAKKYASYLKALETISRAWKRKGFDIGIDLKSMTPTEAQAFVEYLDYRFSQGDFTQMYVIDEFVQDFSRIVKKGHKPKQVIADFEKFLENRRLLQRNADEMEGLTSGQFMSLWGQFADNDSDWEDGEE